MAIVIEMRSLPRIVAVLLVALAAAVVAAPAQAGNPAVDQYTEELPNPNGTGGNQGNNPDENAGNGGQNGSGNGNGSGSTGYSGTGSDSTGTSTYSSGSDNGKSGKKPDQKSGKKDAGKEDKAESKGKEDKTLAAVAPSGGDDGGSGLGWIFPVAIIVVTGLVGGFAYLRRNRGSLAT